VASGRLQKNRKNIFLVAIPDDYVEIILALVKDMDIVNKKNSKVLP
jgi:hypothetical protein